MWMKAQFITFKQNLQSSLSFKTDQEGSAIHPLWSSERTNYVRSDCWDPFKTATRASRQTRRRHMRPVSGQRLGSVLKASKLKCRRHHIRPDLTPQHRNSKLNLVQMQRNWQHLQWDSVLFCNKVWIWYDKTDWMVGIFRQGVQRYHQENVAENNTLGGASMMSWGEIRGRHLLGTFIFQNPVCQCNGWVTARDYVETLL